MTWDCFTWHWCQEQHPPSNGPRHTNKPSATTWDLVKPAAGRLARGLVPNSIWNGDVTSCSTSSARNSLAVKQPAVFSSELSAAEILPKADQYSAAAPIGVGSNDERCCCHTGSYLLYQRQLLSQLTWHIPQGSSSEALSVRAIAGHRCFPHSTLLSAQGSSVGTTVPLVWLHLPLWKQMFHLPTG